MTIFYTQGSDFQVNTTTLNDQVQPTVTALAAGGYLVTWIDVSSGFEESIGQVFDAGGNKVGVEFSVGRPGHDSNYDGYFDAPLITGLSSGGFVAVWSDGNGGSYAQIFDGSGSPAGSEFLLPPYQVSAIASLPSGGFVVGSVYDQYAILHTYDASGAFISEGPLTFDFIDPNSPGLAITSMPTGEFVVSWNQLDRSTYDGGHQVVAQVFNAAGEPVGSRLIVSEVLPYLDGSPPAITSLSSGGFVVSWTSVTEPNTLNEDRDVTAQIFDAAGSAVGAPFLVNSMTASFQGSSEITALPSGGFVVSWLGDGVRAQVFDADGFKVGAETSVGTDAQAYQVTISSLASGDIVFAWSDLGGDGSGTSVRSQIFTQTDVYSGTSGNDVLVGTPGDDQIDGLGGNDYLIGLAGNDVLNGGDGNDRFEGGDGNDTLNGGAGIDGVSYINSTSNVFVDLAQNYAQLFGEEFIDTLSSIEDVSGSDFFDYISGNDSNNTLAGRGGNDMLYGNGGNDRLRGGSGADEMYGGTGNDSYEVDDPYDVVGEGFGEGTADRVDTSLDNYQLPDHVERLTLTGSTVVFGYGNALANVIVGNSADNFLFGFDGNDSLNGGLGADFLEGGIGNDVYYVDNAGDTVNEGADQGKDRVKSSVDYVLGADVERLTLSGSGAISGTGNDLVNIITGNGAANTLRGEGRNDTLSGGAGDDQLHGGIGSDRLTGGTGADGFHFDTALNARNNVDTIVDFTVADDTIYLDQSVFGELDLGTLAEGAFVNGTAAADADDRIIYDSATGKIYYDADGDGAGAQVLFAQVTAGTALSEADFFTVG